MCKNPNSLIYLVLVSIVYLVFGTVVQARMPEAVGFWRFEGDTTDSGIGGHDGILEGTATLVSDPERGLCLKLDGDGYVDIPSGVAELGAADFTIAAWIKTTEIGMCVLSKSNGDTFWNSMEKQLYIADSATSEGQNSDRTGHNRHLRMCRILRVTTLPPKMSFRGSYRSNRATLSGS